MLFSQKTRLNDTKRAISGYKKAARTRSRRRIEMIRKLKSGMYRIYSRSINPKTGKRRNLGTFSTREGAIKHEREIQFFKRRGG